MARPQWGTTRASGQSKGPAAVVEGGGVGRVGQRPTDSPQWTGPQGFERQGEPLQPFAGEE